MSIHICSFSGAAADIKPKDRNVDTLVQVLKTSPRISTWDMSELIWLRDLVSQAKRTGLITEVEEEPYPWHKFEVKE